MNTETPNKAASNEPSGSTAPGSRVLRWHRRVLGICLIIFALELGLFLLVYPWRRDWEMSWIPVHSPSLAAVWMSAYFRGAISGLGLLNLAVAAAEFSKQVKMFGRSNRK
jgi:hypothetical protein